MFRYRRSRKEFTNYNSQSSKHLWNLIFQLCSYPFKWLFKTVWTESSLSTEHAYRSGYKPFKEWFQCHFSCQNHTCETYLKLKKKKKKVSISVGYKNRSCCMSVLTLTLVEVQFIQSSFRNSMSVHVKLFNTAYAFLVSSDLFSLI